MNSVRNKHRGEFIPRQQTLDDIVMPMQLLRHAITQVRAKTEPRRDRLIDLIIVRVGMTRRDLHVPGNGSGDYSRGTG